jgi:hypothetical protein
MKSAVFCQVRPRSFAPVHVIFVVKLLYTFMPMETTPQYGWGHRFKPYTAHYHFP